MRGTVCAEVEAFPTIASLPPGASALVDQAPSVFGSRVWWDLVLGHAIPDGAQAVFLVVRCAGRIAALLPMLRTADGRLNSLTTPYTCEYTPLLAADIDPRTRLAAMTAFARFCRPFGIVRLDAIPQEWNDIDALAAGIGSAGLCPLRFAHFGGWVEDVRGLGWSAYLVRRPGALRETIRRRLRHTGDGTGRTFDLMTSPAEMDTATRLFDAVYQRSWKRPEPYPTFNAALMLAMAASGMLRFGVWWIGTTPAAVQIWVVKDGRATVLKLAHDEALRAHSPGSVLTAMMLRHLLEREDVTLIDFGRGDDAYKRAWASCRLQRVGLLAVNPWRPAGSAELLHHMAGRARASLGAVPRLMGAWQRA